MEAPNIAHGDTSGFKWFALKVRALVGMLDQLGDSGKTELHCGSHVTWLLSKLPHDIYGLSLKDSCTQYVLQSQASSTFLTGLTTS